MNKVFHPFTKWEDLAHGMFASRNNGCFSSMSKGLLTDPQHFNEACHRVTVEWPNSAAHNLSNSDYNRKAWLGQAACCLVVGSTEQETRVAWATLTQQEKDQANIIADIYINAYCQANDEAKNFSLGEEMGKDGVPSWNPGICSVAGRTSK